MRKMLEVTDTRSRILAEGGALVREQGVAGLSMRKVAARVGLSATALYRHFDGKEALVAAICVEGFARFGQFLWRALSQPTARQRLSATSVQYRNFALQNANFYSVMFLNSCGPAIEDRLSDAEKNNFRSTFVFLMDRIEECMVEGLLAKGDSEQIAACVWAHCHGLVALRLHGHLAHLTGEQFEGFYDSSCRALVRGLASAES